MEDLRNGTAYEQYAIENKILNKNNNFLSKKTGTAKFSFAITYNNETFGVWNDYKENKVIVSYDYDRNSEFNFAVTMNDHSPNTMMISSVSKYKFWKNFMNHYRAGVVYFESQKIKQNISEVIRLFLNR